MAIETAIKLRAAIQGDFPDLSTIEHEALTQFGLALQSGRGVLFLGAGVSIDSGIPSGIKLVSYFQEVTNSSSTSLRQLCTTYEKQYSSYRLQHTLSDYLNDWDKPLTPVHALIPKIENLQIVITTNVDTRIEEACRTFHRPYQSFVFPRDLAYRRPDFLCILKIHGTLEHPHTLIFSDQDHDRIKKDDSDFEINFEIKLKGLFQENEILTLGYSAADDPDFDYLISWMTPRTEGKQILSIQIDPEQAKQCRRNGVMPILLHNTPQRDAKDRIPSLLGLLAGLQKDHVPQGLIRVDRKHNPFHRLEAYREQDSYRFVGRQKDLQIIFSTLQQHRLLVLFGDSAIGKTSFINAAIIPYFKKEYGKDTVMIETVSDDLQESWHTLIKNIPAKKTYLFILDQLERFFDPPVTELHRNQFFLDLLPKAQKEYPNLYCLFVIRRERFPELHRYKEVSPGIYHDCLELSPLDVNQAKEVILCHFGEAGYSLQPDLIDSIVDYSCLGDRDIPYLPALQLYGYAQFEHLESLRQTKELSESKPISIEYSIAQPDVLRDFMTEALQVFQGDDLHALLLRVLRRLTLYSRRQQLKRSHLSEDFPDPGAARAVLDRLVERRLVRFIPEKEAYELVHDTLVNLVEGGPLALDPDYSEADIIAYIVYPDCRSRTNIDQRRGLLRYGLKHNLPIVPWLQLLSDVNINQEETLFDLCQDADLLVSTAAINCLREKGDLSTPSHNSYLRRYLITSIFSALDEKVHPSKGKAAALFLLSIGLDDSDVKRFMDFIDPLREMELAIDDEPDIDMRVLTEYDREMIDLVLPALLKNASDEDLCGFAKYIFIHHYMNLGPLLYSQVLIELGRRDMQEELLERYRLLQDERIGDTYSEIESEAVLRSLSQIETNPEPVEEFDEIRRFLIVGSLYGRKNKELMPSVIVVMKQLSRRYPVEVMQYWLDTFVRWSYDEEIWPLFRSLAVYIVSANEEALKLLLHRLSVVYSSSEQISLSEVLLWAEPNCDFRTPVSETLSPMERNLLGGLDATPLQHLILHVNKDGTVEINYTQIEKLSALGLWRAGVFFAKEVSISYYHRWKILLNLSIVALHKAAVLVKEAPALALVEKVHPEAPLTMDSLFQMLDKIDNMFFEKYFIPAKNKMAEKLKIFPQILSEAPPIDQIERLMHWVNVVLVNTPNMNCPNAAWPPLECTPDQFPALSKVMESMAQIEMYITPELQRHWHATRKAYEEWASACTSVVRPLLSVYKWMVQRAAELAAEEGHPRYEAWFRELMGVTENGIPFMSRQGSPLLRWVFRRSWDDHPWWVLYNDPREVSLLDEKEILCLIESALEFEDIDKVCPVVRHWLGEVLSEACICGTGFLGEHDVGVAFYRLCSTPWVTILAPFFHEKHLEILFEDSIDDHVRAGLLLWAESEHTNMLEKAAYFIIGEKKIFKHTAVVAIDRWFERRKEKTL